MKNKAKIIFYSWQSDLPEISNKSFIKNALEKSIYEINEKIIIENSDRNEDVKLKLDHDIKDEPGSPPIVESIFKKIDSCEIFLADLTFVGKTEINPNTKKFKPIPNPNVLIEYGYAFKSIGYSKVICVMNTAFGEPTPENVPFNIRHQEFPIQYNLKPESVNEQIIESVQESLSEKLIEKIKLILDSSSIAQDTLKSELLVDDSKFYIHHDETKLIIVIKLRVLNTGDRAILINVDNLELNFFNNWKTTDRLKIHDGTIRTTTARVGLGSHKNTLIKLDEYKRIQEYDSVIISAIFEYKFDLLTGVLKGVQELDIRGTVKSLDDRYSNFQGTINGYK